MTQEQIQKAISLNRELESLKKMAIAMKEERSYWWSFLTPNIKEKNARGIFLPDRLCCKFEAIVEQSIAEIEKEIEEL